MTEPIVAAADAILDMTDHWDEEHLREKYGRLAADAVTVAVVEHGVTPVAIAREADVTPLDVTILIDDPVALSHALQAERQRAEAYVAEVIATQQWHAARRVAAGVTQTDVGAEMGVTYVTVGKWVKAAASA